MKPTLVLLLISSLAAVAVTGEQLNQRFAVQPEGKLVVDVDFGSIDITTHADGEVVLDVWRKITRKNKADDEEFLKDHPVTFSHASTSAGRVTTDLPVTVVGQGERGHLEGAVNGGGKSVVLRSSSGSIHLKKR